jgi:primosomal protein N' (replication factor Y)
VSAENHVWQADIALDIPGREAYSYLLPEGVSDLAVGTCVTVPFAGRKACGFVLAVEQRALPTDYALKSILAISPEVRLPPALVALIRWGARYYRCALGEFLAGAVPAPVREGAQRERTALVAPVAGFSGTLTVRQREVLALLPPEPTPVPRILELTKATRGVLDKLIAAGAAVLTDMVRDKEIHLQARHERFALTDEQQIAVDAVAAAVRERRHEPFLLYGVTGSGKTLVYLELAQQVIASGRQVLYLLPEIGLTPQLGARVRTRFPEVVVWHSAQADGDRAESWRRCARGEVSLVVGTRSALFAPLPDLGLIIVDEEHETSYKQESVPRYHARDLALVYGRQLAIPVILGSATPSMETVHNGRSKRFTVLTLKQRPLGGNLPTPILIDMREECSAQKAAAVLSRELVTRLGAIRAAGEQAIVLLNRRGWSPVVSCKGCGATIMCPQCDISLTWHRGADLLRCHYCNHQTKFPKTCPTCQAPQLSTHGLGTEQLAHALTAAVPGLSVLRVDADTVGERQGHAKLFQAFAEGRADCLVGTQMVAKGLDFPRVTLVGIICADKGLAVPDFRAAEKTWQLIAQVSGRAGRGAKPGTVVVQAFDTQALALRAALEHRPRTFIDAELKLREEYGYPPYAGLIRILWSGESEANVQLVAQEHGARLSGVLDGAVLLGPNPAGVALLKGQHRWHALIKAATRGAAQSLLDRLAAAGGLPRGKGVNVVVDVDPYVTS